MSLWYQGICFNSITVTDVLTQGLPFSGADVFTKQGCTIYSITAEKSLTQSYTGPYPGGWEMSLWYQGICFNSITVTDVLTQGPPFPGADVFTKQG